MSRIIRNETVGALCGVPGRWHAVMVDDDANVIRNQRFTSEWREYDKDESRYRIAFVANYDDACNNGHETCAVTGEIQRRLDDGGIHFRSGCIHDAIAEHFPEIAHLIRWHLCSTDGPLHYLQNTLYLAGIRDYDGLLAGEPSQNPVHQKHFIKFGDSPIEHAVSARLRKFIMSDPEYVLDKVEHAKAPHVYSPKFQFAGMDCTWHECPFDTEQECQQWLEALTECETTWVVRTAKFGKGKERELDAARKTAVWPEAADDELMADPSVLRKKLEDRLPGLIAAFRRDIESAGFLFSFS